VIFYDIIGFQRRAFVQIISISQKSADLVINPFPTVALNLILYYISWMDRSKCPFLVIGYCPIINFISSVMLLVKGVIMKWITRFYYAFIFLTVFAVLSSSHAVASDDFQQGDFTAFIPLIIMFIVFFFAAIPIIKRKGEKKIKWFILMIIPIVNTVAFAYLLSLTDKNVLQRLEALEKKVNKTD
jgi:hypothetical protein